MLTLGLGAGRWDRNSAVNSEQGRRWFLVSHPSLRHRERCRGEETLSEAWVVVTLLTRGPALSSQLSAALITFTVHWYHIFTTVWPDNSSYNIATYYIISHLLWLTGADAGERRGSRKEESDMKQIDYWLYSIWTICGSMILIAWIVHWTHVN